MKQKPEHVAQVCEQGHLINPSINNYPDSKSPFCEKCGSSTITGCKNCDWPIRGRGPYSWMAEAGPFQPPKFCGECGTPFPWTQAVVDAARSLTDEQDALTPEEKVTMKASIDQLTSDTALTPVAANKFKTLAKKIGPQAGELLKSLVLAIATGEAKRHLGLP